MKMEMKMERSPAWEPIGQHLLLSLQEYNVVSLHLDNDLNSESF